MLFRSVYYIHNCSATPNLKKTLNKLIQIGYGDHLIANFIKSHLYLFPEKKPDQLKCFLCKKDNIEEICIKEYFSTRLWYMENILLGFVNEKKLKKNVAKEELLNYAQCEEQYFFILDYFYVKTLIKNFFVITKVTYDLTEQNEKKEFNIIYETKENNIYMKKYVK